MDFSHEDVAGEVRAWMARRQQSGRGVAAELGCSEIYLSRRLTGKIPFNVAELAKIADLLKVPVASFFEAPMILGVRKQDNRHPLAGLARAS